MGRGDWMGFAVKILNEEAIVLRLRIEGDPKSKERARVSFGRRGAHAFTPATTRMAEDLIGWAVRGVFKGPPDATSAFGLSVKFGTANRRRRDIDNMAKLVCDALTGIVWKDDVQVEELHAVLARAVPEPHTEILVFRIQMRALRKDQ